MKRITVTLVCIFFLCLPGIKAQQNHFIYIQTENKQPFYIKLDKKMLTSSVSGYLIIPRLQDGIYNMSIGFPKNEWPEQNVVCQVDNKDLGYLLKNFGDKGWGLFNLQTMEIVMAGKKDGTNAVASAEAKPDAFSSMLSTVVNDPSIKQNEPIKEEVKKQPVKEEAVTIQAETKEKIQTEVPHQLIKSKITKTSSNKKTDGDEIVYLVAANGKEDTVRILIPADKEPSTQKIESPKEELSTIKENQAAEKPKEDIKQENKEEPIKQVEKKKDEKFLPIEMPGSNTRAEETKQPVKQDTEYKTENTVAAEKISNNQSDSTEKKKIVNNSDCKNLASDEDFLKLRKKMASEEKEEGMVSLAKKAFKSKCFTTEHIKNLAALFLKDSGKYNFFDLAYPYVSDTQNYYILESQLSDSYYISRFKAMIRH